ncbi:MAG: hypothetical protein V6Z78_00750 [Holosporaceae bacterium]
MFSASYKISSVLLCGFVVGLLPGLAAMDPEKDGTEPTACAAKPLASAAPQQPDSGKPFQPNHMTLANLFELNTFLAKAEGGEDPSVNHTGITLRGKLLHDLITPTKADDVACDCSTAQKTELFERLENYCKHNSRSLGINIHCPSEPTVVSKPESNGVLRWTTVPGIQNLCSYQRLFDLPVTHVNIFGMVSLNDISALEACKKTLQSLIIHMSAIEKADVFGQLTNLREVSVKSPLLSDLNAFSNCRELRTASFANCQQVTDASPLQYLPVLKHLDLFNCDITDASIFCAFSALSELNLRANYNLDRSCLPALNNQIETLTASDMPHAQLFTQELERWAEKNSSQHKS